MATESLRTDFFHYLRSNNHIAYLQSRSKRASDTSGDDEGWLRCPKQIPPGAFCVPRSDAAYDQMGLARLDGWNAAEMLCFLAQRAHQNDHRMRW
jgi:hypothetical protein